MSKYNNKMLSNTTQNQRTILVYVHLGKLIPDELLHHAKLACSIMAADDIYLITDAECGEFPGKVISCISADWDERFSRYLNRFPEISETDHGYWDVTLRRLLALELLTDMVDNETKIIHVESDVMILLPIPQILSALEGFKLPAIPRLAKNGIASFLYFPSTLQLSLFCENVLRILESTKVPLTDMKLLGIGLSNGWLQEIPSTPSNAILENKKIIFDGAAIGQYLFGVNPIHTGGLLQSGFQNPYFSDDLSAIHWQMDSNANFDVPCLVAKSGRNRLVVANLHIHSKDLLPFPDMNSDRWIRAMQEANGADRLVEVRVTGPSRGSGISVKGKLRKASRIGLLGVIKIVVGKIVCRFR